MAVLADTERIKVWRAFMRLNAEATPYTKTQLKAAVDAADDWADTNASAYNTALPVAFRNNASTTQKSILLCYVIMRRAGLLTQEGL